MGPVRAGSATRRRSWRRARSRSAIRKASRTVISPPRPSRSAAAVASSVVSTAKPFRKRSGRAPRTGVRRGLVRPAALGDRGAVRRGKRGEAAGLEAPVGLDGRRGGVREARGERAACCGVEQRPFACGELGRGVRLGLRPGAQIDRARVEERRRRDDGERGEGAEEELAATAADGGCGVHGRDSITCGRRGQRAVAPPRRTCGNGRDVGEWRAWYTTASRTPGSTPAWGRGSGSRWNGLPRTAPRARRRSRSPSRTASSRDPRATSRMRRIRRASSSTAGSPTCSSSRRARSASSSRRSRRRAPSRRSTRRRTSGSEARRAGPCACARASSSCSSRTRRTSRASRRRRAPGRCGRSW